MSFTKLNDFSTNMDDGELRVLSNFILAKEAPHRRRFVPNNNNLNIFNQHPQILNSKIPKGLEVPGQYPLNAPFSQNGYYGVNVGPTVDHGLFRNPFGVGPLTIPMAPRQPFCYPVHHPHPQGSEYVELMDMRSAAGMNSQYGQQNPHGFANYLMNEGHRFEGTGVFIPRAPSTLKPTTKNIKSGVPPLREGGKNDNAVEKPRSSEARLPQDWTY